MTEEKKKLYRSRSDRMIGGVCGGLGEYFGIDTTLIRIGFIVALLFAGHGLLIYLACLILMPLEPTSTTLVENLPASPSPTLTPEEPQA
jgi:phage shock protein C